MCTNTKSSAQSTFSEDLGQRLDVERSKEIHDVRNRCFRELMTETEPEKVWFFFEKPILQAKIIVQRVQCRIRQARLVDPGQDTRGLFWSFKSRLSRGKRSAVQSSRGTFEPPSIGAFSFTFISDCNLSARETGVQFPSCKFLMSSKSGTFKKAGGY
ncbi:hypothetical protein BDD12DRAFT_814391 [Trichophaea hybrida]|nr:hypothetical protein BDD12DRAFT_814391 [Trichophaea hybrida]